MTPREQLRNRPSSTLEFGCSGSGRLASSIALTATQPSPGKTRSTAASFQPRPSTSKTYRSCVSRKSRSEVESLNKALHHDLVSREHTPAPQICRAPSAPPSRMVGIRAPPSASQVPPPPRGQLRKPIQKDTSQATRNRKSCPSRRR